MERVVARLRIPFMSAWGTINDRELVLVRIQDPHGGEGFGEAAPLPGYREATADDVVAALERCRDVLWDGDDCGRHELLAACASEAALPEALAAIDVALFDLACRRIGAPLYRLLGGAPRSKVEVNATISAAEPAAATAEAGRARDAGYRCVKVKVGIGGDLERVAAVRAAVGPEISVRLDANGAWSLEQAVGLLVELAPFGIELCEEPVHGLEAVARVAAAVSVPIALDESATLDGALDRRVCAAVCLKVASCGGVSGVRRAAKRARAAGYQVYLASTLDGPLGIAAALHAAAAIGPELPCGLATLGMFANRADPLPPAEDGWLRMPPGPGLGDGLLDWYG